MAGGVKSAAVAPEGSYLLQILRRMMKLERNQIKKYRFKKLRKKRFERTRFPPYQARAELKQSEEKPRRRRRFKAQFKMLAKREDDEDGSTLLGIFTKKTIIHHDDPARSLWEWFVTVLSIYSVISVPMVMAYPSVSTPTGLELVFDFIFFVDILVCMRTTHRCRGNGNCRHGGNTISLPQGMV